MWVSVRRSLWCEGREGERASVGNWPLVDFNQEIVCDAEERERREIASPPPWASERYSSVLHREANWERKKAEGENDLLRAGQISPLVTDLYFTK